MALLLGSSVMMPFERRLSTLCPFFGTYVAKTWSKLRFSPMITMTCLIGVVVSLSPVCWANNDVPTVNWRNARDASPMREHSEAFDLGLFKNIQAPFSMVM